MKSIITGVYSRDSILSNACSFGEQLISSQYIKVWGARNTSDITRIEDKNCILLISGNFSCINLTYDLEFFLNQTYKLINFLSGQYTFVIYHKLTHKLIIGGDEIGIYPLFYYKSANNLYFSNEYENLVSLLPNIKLDTKSINFYLKFGFTPDGFTFIKNLRMLERNVMLDMHKHKFSKKKHRSSIKKVNLTINDSIDLFYKKLVNVHKEFLKRTPPENTLVTLSGGLDTRLNFALIHDKKRYKYSSFYTPPLNEKEDKDTLIASIFANKYGINLKIDKFQLINEKLAISYYKNQQDSTNVKVVTGLLGGEFLSNSFVRFIQNNVRDLYKKKSFEKAKHLFNQEDRMLLKMFKETDGFYQFMTTILYRSFFSNFYGGTEGYWSNPYKHILRYYSVFTEPDIVKTLWSIPEDYILYSNNKFQLLLYERYFKEYTKIGTNSKLKNITDYGFSYFEEGLEPKNNRINRSEHLYEIALNNLNKHKEIIINEHSNKQNIIDLNTWITFLDSLKK